MAGKKRKKVERVDVGRAGDIEAYFGPLSFSVWADDLIVTGSAGDFLRLLKHVDDVKCGCGSLSVSSRNIALTFKSAKGGSKFSIARIDEYADLDVDDDLYGSYEPLKFTLYFAVCENPMGVDYVICADAGNPEELDRLVYHLLDYIAPTTVVDPCFYGTRQLEKDLEMVKGLKAMITDQNVDQLIKSVFPELVEVLKKRLDEAEKRLMEVYEQSKTKVI
jgi:hypothetical protein